MRSKVNHRCSKLAKCGLSIFGRGHASAGYVSSVVLYHAEHAGFPPSGLLQHFKKTINRLVSRNGKQLGFTGISSDLIAGHPRTGGFGALHLESHLTARHAKHGLQLLLAKDPHPWILLARNLMAHAINRPVRGHRLELLSRIPLTVKHSIETTPLLAMLEAVTKLPTPRLSGLEAGPWCVAIPLWNNPLLPSL